MTNISSFEKANRYGAIAATARSLQRPDDLPGFTPEEIEYYFVVQHDAIRRIVEVGAISSADGSFRSTVLTSSSRVTRLIEKLMPPAMKRMIRKSDRAIRKFVRQNVREFRRSRDRASGIRAVVLWPVAAIFYLTGFHRVQATRPVKAIRKFVRQNVREFRRSRDRASGIRAVVLWPVAAIFYLTGSHRIISTVRNSRNRGGNT